MISLLLAATLLLAQQRCDSTATGDIDIIPFESKVFANTRMLRVLLPPGYRLAMNRTHRYPVLYLNDGQNLFDTCTSTSGKEWRVDKTVIALTSRDELPPIIVVGIDNAGRRLRAHEYLPYPDETLSPPDSDPQGKLYAAFVADEVVPFVEDRYRARGAPGSRVLGGSSYGAGAALYAAIARPGVFSGLLLESPSVYASDYQLLKDLEKVTELPRHVFIGTGTVNEPVQDSQRLFEIFQKKGGFDDHHLRRVVTEGGRHTEESWAARLPAALKFFFGSP